ncbi:hypothetical protein [Rubripirellula reticaptiva]|uniref:Uncharacterized protein n=1 Tax=Rubripirellula reticaptiva TaxID=2528013 RepID=A0A5C6EIA1_9BACT|nr:hypothetical protein [Rubripirellula reticaptiva]TWU47797.1 hypothetical protein Poly59_46390 [Rubripirellula reticaptiva]
MKRRSFSIACTVMAVIVAATMTYGVRLNAAVADPILAPFTFDREGASSPEDAASALFRGCAMESPKDFVRHLLLGVCDGSVDTLQKFAQCLHETKFSHGEESFTVYELPKRMNPNRPVRVVASEAFDPDDRRVVALRLEMVSTYYAEKFMCVAVVAEGYDGREYGSRIVVGQLGDQWYAIPRCRSANRFYGIADTMQMTSVQD